MDDTLPNKREDLIAVELGKLLSDHNGVEVMVMDMRPLDYWTDFFVIATATSNTHMTGLERHIKDFIQEKELEILHRSGKIKNEKDAELRSDEWRLLDLGGIVIHLMTARLRSFFELERLWSAAPIIYQGAGVPLTSSHSSKSS